MQVPTTGTIILYMYIGTESQTKGEVYLLCLVQEPRYSCEEESVSVGKDTAPHL
jgi:hypothetical protein